MMPAPKQGLSKKALTAIIAGGVGLILLIVGIILAVVLLGPPSKADYKKAYDKAEAMVTKYNNSSSTFSGAFTDDLKNAKTDSDIDKAVDKVKADYDKDNTELAGMKAMNDSEVKKAFDDYKKKYDAAFPYIKTTLKGYLAYQSISKACSYSAISSMSYSTKDKASAQSDYDNKAKPCLDALKTFESSNDQKQKDFAKAYKDYIQKMHDYVGAYAEASATKNYSAMSNLDRPSSVDLPYASDLMPKSGESDSYEFTNEFNDLVEILHKKAN